METTVIAAIILAVLIIGLAYLGYQLARNSAVFNIRLLWIDNDDPRWYKYSYDYMFNPKLDNWLGLKYPRDKDYI